MSEIEVREYVSADGSNRFRKWFDKLDKIAAAKVGAARLKIAAGNTANIKWFSGIGEYRINWGPGYRIYLVKEGESLIILFGGRTKKRQQSDITQATRMYKEYKERKRNGS